MANSSLFTATWSQRLAVGEGEGKAEGKGRVRGGGGREGTGREGNAKEGGGRARRRVRGRVEEGTWGKGEGG